MIQQKFQESGKIVTLKELTNIRKDIKNQGGNDIETLVEYLNSRENATVEVLVDSDNKFNGVFYQDRYMRDIYQWFPDVLLADATFKLLDLRYQLYLLLAIDRNCISEIVALFIVADEAKLMIEIAVKIFQK